MQMIPMITKEKLVQTIRTNKALFRETIEAIIYYLELPTPSLNPMKIDEERMESILIGIGGDAYYKNQTRKAIKIYNSTLEDHQVLQPLPKDKPDWFEWSLDTSKYDLWDELVKTYGTPTKKELVSVEELEKEIYDSTVNLNDNECKVLAKNLVNKYGLNPPKREWWMDLKEGDKFMKGCYTYELSNLDSHVRLYTEQNGYFLAEECQPYIEPSIHDKVKEKLGIELYQEFMKEVKG